MTVQTCPTVGHGSYEAWSQRLTHYELTAPVSSKQTRLSAATITHPDVMAHHSTYILRCSIHVAPRMHREVKPVHAADGDGDDSALASDPYVRTGSLKLVRYCAMTTDSKLMLLVNLTNGHAMCDVALKLQGNATCTGQLLPLANKHAPRNTLPEQSQRKLSAC